MFQQARSDGQRVGERISEYFPKKPGLQRDPLIVGTDDPARLATPEEQQRLAHASIASIPSHGDEKKET